MQYLIRVSRGVKIQINRQIHTRNYTFYKKLRLNFALCTTF